MYLNKTAMTQADKANEGRDEIEKEADEFMKTMEVESTATNKLYKSIYIAGAMSENNRLRDQLSELQQQLDATLRNTTRLLDQLSKEREMIKDKLIRFKRWYDKLSPSDKCTVWPPAGSGSGTGLYDMPDEDLIDKFLKYLAKATELDKK